MIENYEELLGKYKAECYRESVLSFSNLYAGHMLYDVTRPHFDALVEALGYQQNAVAFEAAPLSQSKEEELVKDIATEIGYRDGFWGYITTGGSISNLEALWIARDKAKSEKKSAKYVIASNFNHYSMNKACMILGMEMISPENIDSIHPEDIAAVVCVVGTTVEGISEDVPKWLKFCKENKIHFHIDGAYGGYYIYCKDSPLLTQKSRDALKLLCEADSITIDPHKLGYAPYPSGLFLLKNGKDKRFVLGADEVSYIHATHTSSFTVEGSRSGAIILSTHFGHMVLKRFYGKILQANLEGADLLKKYIRKSKVFELYENTDMGFVLFKVKQEEENKKEENKSSTSSFSTNEGDEETLVPMKYIVDKYCNVHNVQHNRVQLVTAKVNDELYFRICVMNPFLKDNIDLFTTQLEKDYEQYKKEYLQQLNN